MRSSISKSADDEWLSHIDQGVHCHELWALDRQTTDVCMRCWPSLITFSDEGSATSTRRAMMKFLSTSIAALLVVVLPAASGSIQKCSKPNFAEMRLGSIRNIYM
jgi:hypothetical protein